MTMREFKLFLLANLLLVIWVYVARSVLMLMHGQSIITSWRVRYTACRFTGHSILFAILYASARCFQLR
jgi:hypothetical protein